MHKQLTLLCVLFIIGITGYAQKTVYNYKLTGTVKGFTGQKLYLEKLNLNKVVVLDSTSVNKKDKTFSFTGSSDEQALYRIRIGSSGNNGFLVSIDKPNNNISFAGDSVNIPEFNYKVTGSTGSDQMRDNISKAVTTYNIVNQLDNQLFSNQNLSEKERNELQTQRNQINDSHLDKLYHYSDTASNPVAVIFCVVSLLSPDDHFEQWKKVDTRLRTKAYDFSLAQEFSKQVKDIQASIEQQNNPPQGISIGAIAPEISLPDTTGKEILLSSLRGKYVLIDFWASWCGPCRIENPNVVSAYNKFKDKGFTIYSVSLDQDKGRWIKAIKADQLSWLYHVSELKGWNSSVCKDYSISSIPNNYLLDPQGKVIASGLRGEELHKTLEKYLK